MIPKKKEKKEEKTNEGSEQSASPRVSIVARTCMGKEPLVRIFVRRDIFSQF